MNGALPPSSSDIFFTVPAHCAISFLPISVEPVKVSLRTVGFDGHLAADRGGGSRDDVEYALRDAGPMAELRQRQRGIGGLGRRLADHGASRPPARARPCA